MAEEVAAAPSSEQTALTLDNGVVLTGMGGDIEQIQEQIDQRNEISAPPEPVETPAAVTPAKADQLAAARTTKALRGQARFDELTRQREEADRRTVAAEARTKELEAKLAAPPAQHAAVVSAAPVAATPVSTLRPQPVEAEIGTKYATYADFILDTGRWAAEEQAQKTIQTLDARSQASIEADRASRSRMDLANASFVRGRTAYPDFDAVLASVDDILIPPAYQAAILAVPQSEHVLYALGKDRTKLEAILKIQDGVRLGLELAQFIPREVVASPASTAPVVRTTNVPAPVQPVGAGSRTTSPSAEELAAKGGNDFDGSGYREKRRKELGRPPLH